MSAVCANREPTQSYQMIHICSLHKDCSHLTRTAATPEPKRGLSCAHKALHWATTEGHQMPTAGTNWGPTSSSRGAGAAHQGGRALLFPRPTLCASGGPVAAASRPKAVQEEPQLAERLARPRGSREPRQSPNSPGPQTSDPARQASRQTDWREQEGDAESRRKPADRSGRAGALPPARLRNRAAQPSRAGRPLAPRPFRFGCAHLGLFSEPIHLGAGGPSGAPFQPVDGGPLAPGHSPPAQARQSNWRPPLRVWASAPQIHAQEATVSRAPPRLSSGGRGPARAISQPAPTRRPPPAQGGRPEHRPGCGQLAAGSLNGRGR